MGISSTALYYAVNKSLIEDRGTVSEEFFRACRRSFRQATLSFLALAVPESILLADCFMTHYLKGQQAATGNPWIIFTVLSTCGLAWMIYNAAYAARFDDPVKKTVLQSGAMALLHFDKSLLLLVVLAAFGLLTAFCPPLILLAPAGYALFARWVLEKKVFYQYLPDLDDGIDKENKDCSHQD